MTGRRVKRDARIRELREQGYTYEAIAHQLHAEGLTDRIVSRVRIHELLRGLAPHLMGHTRLRGLPTVRKDDVKNGSA